MMQASIPGRAMKPESVHFAQFSAAFAPDDGTIAARLLKTSRLDAEQEQRIEGLALMVLAEALLRVPDARTADQFIEDKLAEGDFIHHETKSSAFLVNASAWALGVSARVIQPD